MQLAIPYHEFDKNNVFFGQRTNNTVLEGSSFYRIMYSDEGVIMNGIYVLLDIQLNHYSPSARTIDVNDLKVNSNNSNIISENDENIDMFDNIDNNDNNDTTVSSNTSNKTDEVTESVDIVASDTNCSNENVVPSNGLTIDTTTEMETTDDFVSVRSSRHNKRLDVIRCVTDVTETVTELVFHITDVIYHQLMITIPAAKPLSTSSIIGMVKQSVSRALETGRYVDKPKVTFLFKCSGVYETDTDIGITCKLIETIHQ